MKKVKLLWVVLSMILLISACSHSSVDSSDDMIVPPKNQLMPLEGVWEIEDILTTESPVKNENREDWLGKQVQFSRDHMYLRGISLEKPQYQMKTVNAESYLLFNSKSLPSDFSFPNKEIEVITVIDNERFFCDILILDSEEIILKIQGYSLLLNKLSDHTGDYVLGDITKENDGNGEQIKDDKVETTDTGVLIGLRSKNTDSDAEDQYDYRTLWISSIHNESGPVLQMDHLFFPRRSGFWKITVNQEQRGNILEESILSSNVLMNESQIEANLRNKKLNFEGSIEASGYGSNSMESYKAANLITGQIHRRIDYVGNDYISIETTEKGMNFETSKLQLLPIDGLPNANSVKISDILGEMGVISIKSAWEKALNSLKIENADILYREELLENFGMERKLGNWRLKGRINYTKNNVFNTADYNINILPPSKVVFYDTLFVPWKNIKDRVPRALDAYTSPNKDIAIVQTKRELLIYDIHGNELDQYPKIRIDLKEEETVIMAEWATGKYVENWEGIFLKTGGSVLE
ncbi:hypothetical protein [Alkaliphilus oremlandii]|uniref:Lipoprotein n=1 Tax=Alkaliphilus oremlandii (strain OhILAs) TaxID=350688 RepID=A8MFM8_ALKOO|nr:hypothetical protein [Alkaliphilus oremlandii]ABW17667.1 conserved hypothetical protein [Alkaliphilus oremlandii OhILAs]